MMSLNVFVDGKQCRHCQNASLLASVFTQPCLSSFLELIGYERQLFFSVIG